MIKNPEVSNTTSECLMGKTSTRPHPRAGCKKSLEVRLARKVADVSVSILSAVPPIDIVLAVRIVLLAWLRSYLQILIYAKRFWVLCHQLASCWQSGLFC